MNQLERLIIENNQLRQDKERLELALAETERRYRMAKGLLRWSKGNNGTRDAWDGGVTDHALRRPTR